MYVLYPISSDTGIEKKEKKTKKVLPNVENRTQAVKCVLQNVAQLALQRPMIVISTYIVYIAPT